MCVGRARVGLSSSRLAAAGAPLPSSSASAAAPAPARCAAAPAAAASLTAGRHRAQLRSLPPRRRVLAAAAAAAAAAPQCRHHDIQHQQQQQQQQQQQRALLGPSPPPARGLPPLSGTTPHPRRAHTASLHVCRVLTESSSDLALGALAPDFELPEPLTGRSVSLSSLASGAKAVLVMFISNHCPYVVMLKASIAQLAKEYQGKGLAVVAISANSVQTHPQDGPEAMAEDAKKYGFTFPYLYDESQAVAKAYKAACTPEFYVFSNKDSSLKLTYHGQYDDARPKSNKLVTGADLRTALDAALAGGPLPDGFQARPSIGCNIKWHPGQEP